MVLAVLVAASLLGGSAAWDAKPADPATAERTYNRLVDVVYGSYEQRLAGQEYVWLGTELTISRCATRLGLRYPMPTFTPMYTGTHADAGGFTAFAPPLGSFDIAAAYRDSAAVGPQEDAYLARVPPDGRARVAGMINGCRGQAAGYANADRPAHADEASGKFLNVLSRIEKTGPIRRGEADYRACLVRHGIEAEGWVELYLKVQNAFPPPPLKATDATTDRRWLDARDFEHKAAAADTSCRSGLWNRAVIAALPRLERFELNNARLLATVASEWTDITTEVRRLRAGA